jgi:hypothetical protein
MRVSATVPELKNRDRNLAKGIVNCDPAIIRLILLDENGEVLDAVRRSGSVEPESSDPIELDNIGALTSIAIGAARKAPIEVGELTYALFAFGDAKVLLMSLPSVKRLLALRVQRSSNSEYLYNRIMRGLESM